MLVGIAEESAISGYVGPESQICTGCCPATHGAADKQIASPVTRAAAAS